MIDLPEQLDHDPDTMAQVEALTRTVNELIAYIGARDGQLEPEEEN